MRNTMRSRGCHPARMALPRRLASPNTATAAILAAGAVTKSLRSVTCALIGFDIVSGGELARVP